MGAGREDGGPFGVDDPYWQRRGVRGLSRLGEGYRGWGRIGPAPRQPETENEHEGRDDSNLDE